MHKLNNFEDFAKACCVDTGAIDKHMLEEHNMLLQGFRSYNLYIFSYHHS